MKILDGRVAVITGAGSGMGAAMARRFGAAGMKIVVSDIDLSAAQSTVATLAAKGVEAFAVKTDVAESDQVRALADAAYECYGAVHLLCNNAGVVPAGRHRLVWETPLEDWTWSNKVNCMGVVHGIHHFVPRMLAQGEEGHVVTTASVAGLVSSAGSVAYSAAKHAAVRVTEALYAGLLERQAPIGVTLLCPGLVNTRIYESERSRPAELLPGAGAAPESPELQAVADQLYRSAISPDDVAEQVLQAVLSNQFYVLTTSAFDDAIRDRTQAVLERRNPAFASLLSLVQRDQPSSQKERP
ncbi:SDR family NAD(P)-dependent oxidoreductase [Aquabacterium sp.]|uniref:SDR family NAD(P)-dependent oxidoreductase n=1 Tax=Aquabacterium sp. TaxID=1872578 RepID=UPI002BD67D66|nr:SDR family NAD(P)-dependent oxidoreductase [Aquabacterium sp.]HSW06689.1 SDR family NAD(P)-dependent oxidoreductase [Aquabacterium sp.]